MNLYIQDFGLERWDVTIILTFCQYIFKYGDSPNCPSVLGKDIFY